MTATRRLAAILAGDARDIWLLGAVATNFGGVLGGENPTIAGGMNGPGAPPFAPRPAR